MKPRVASPKVNATLVLRNRGAGEQVDSGQLQVAEDPLNRVR
jgi:hypothetical protein